MKNFTALMAFVFLSLLTGALGICIYLMHIWTPPSTQPQVSFTILQGTNFSSVTTQLKKQNLIPNTLLFKLYAKFTGIAKRTKSGTYNFTPPFTAFDILQKFKQGESVALAVSIPEGYNLYQIAQTISTQIPGISYHELIQKATFPNKLFEKYQIKGPNLEGFLFPDTYQFDPGQNEVEILDQMVANFFSKTAHLRAKVPQSPFNLEEWVTFASIIEKETGQAQERFLISSVFYNRLKKKMRLQSDPTTMYGLKKFDKHLTRKDLQTYTPYNTYQIFGLPVAPIACPGLEALEAALYPAKSNYLYFVSKNDGTHQFTESLLNHNKAVDEYQRKRKSQ